MNLRSRRFKLFSFAFLILIAAGSQILFFHNTFSDKLIQEPTISAHESCSPVVKAKIANLSKLRGYENLSENYLRAPLSLQRLTKTTSGNEALVIIQFKSAPAQVNVSKAALKYNKDFAYSFTLDDGKEDAFSAGYPLLSGGTNLEDGLQYPGLFYTDGCGNKIPFRGGLAINSANAAGNDPHINSPSDLTWTQIKQMYDNCWDIFNHSYDHIANTPGIDYTSEITKNNDYVKNKTGIVMTHFVVPSGDAGYVTPALNLGMKAVYNQSGDFPGGDGLKIDPPVNLNQFKLYRRFIADDSYSSMAPLIDEVANKSVSGNHYWFNHFTHHVSKNKNGGSLLFSSFQTLMQHAQDAYGVNGKDNMWMAPLQEVYEYLSMREKTSLRVNTADDKAYVYINFDNVPLDQRRYCLSLIVNADKDIASVECTGLSGGITFHGTGNSKLVNIDWPLSFIENIPSGIIGPRSFDTERVNIYPNPVQEEFTLSIPDINTKNVWISVVTETGIEYPLGPAQIVDGNVNLDIASLNLKRGVYILKVQTADGASRFMKRFVKE